MTGKPCFLQKSRASSLVVIGPSVPGTIGTSKIFTLNITELITTYFFCLE